MGHWHALRKNWKKARRHAKKGKAKRGKQPMKENKVAFASFDTYYFIFSCSLEDIGATLLSSPWQQPLVMLPSPAQTQQLSRQITVNKQHGPAANWKKARRHAKQKRQKRGKKPKDEKEENGVASCFPAVSNCGKNI